MTNNKIFTMHDLEEQFGVSESRFRDRNPHLPADFIQQARNGGRVFEAVVPQQRTAGESAANLVGQGPDSLEKRVRKAVGGFEEWTPLQRENFAVYYGDITNDTKLPKPMKTAAKQLLKRATNLSGPVQAAVKTLAEQVPTQLKNIYQVAGAKQTAKDVESVRQFVQSNGGETSLRSLNGYLMDTFSSDSDRIAGALSGYLAAFGSRGISDLPQDANRSGMRI